MQLLISLKVKYGFPVKALYGFLRDNEHVTWEEFLQHVCSACAIDHDSGQIFLLTKENTDAELARLTLDSLPLLQEGFLEVEIHQFSLSRNFPELFKPLAFSRKSNA